MQGPAFFHETPLVLALPGRRELVDFAVGFRKNVDPLSGMTVNLKEILRWQELWATKIHTSHFQDHFEFLKQAHIFFSGQAQVVGAQIQALQIRFFDQSILRWDLQQFDFSRRAPIEDVSGRVRIVRLRWSVLTEADLRTLRQFRFPQKLSLSFADAAALRQHLESLVKVPIDRMELEDSLSGRAEIF